MNLFTILQILPFLIISGQVDLSEQNFMASEENPLPPIESLSEEIPPVVETTQVEFIIPAEVPDDIELLLIRYSAKYSLPLDVVVRLSEVESNYGAHKQSARPNFDGSVDIGVLALNSNFIDYFADRYYEGIPGDFDPHNPEHNIQTGLAYLAHLHSLTGDLTNAVIAYNCGYVSMKRGDIPQSTQRYARAILLGESL